MNLKCILAALPLLTLSLHGQLVFNEMFHYPNGALVARSAGIWQSTSGTPGSLVLNDGRLELSFARSEDVAVLLPAGPYPLDGPVPSLYLSFRVNFRAVPTAAGGYFAHWTGPQPASHRGRIWAATTTVDGSSAAPGSFYIGIGNSTPSSTVPRISGSGQFPIPLTTNYWYTIVARFAIPSAQASIWLDPRSEADRPSTADDPVAPEDVMDVVSLAFRQAAGIGTLWVDDVRVGTTFASVAGANTAPLISSIPPQSVPAGAVAGPVSFVLGDAESAPESLLLRASSSNLRLVAPDQIRFAGAAEVRSVTVHPTPGEQGEAQIRITVSDGLNESASEFPLRVGFPSVSNIPDQVASSPCPPLVIPFTVNDAESPAGQLQVTAVSDNPLLLPSSSVALYGSGADRSLRLEPAPGRTGTANLKLAVSDGANITQTSFRLTVGRGLGLLLDERFAYEQFGIPNALCSVPGSAWATASGGAGQLQVTNGWAYLTGTNTEDLALALPGGPYYPTNAVLFYASFPVRFSALPSMAGTYFLHFRNSETGISFRGRVFAHASSSGLPCVRLGIANAENTPTDFPRDLPLEATCLVVTRYNSLSGETVLWLDPVSESSPSVTAADAAAPDKVGHVALRQSAGLGNLALGRLRIGTSFGEVSDAIPALTLRRSAQGFELEWSGSGFDLSAASHPGGPFVALPGAQSPYSVVPQDSARFFRLVPQQAPAGRAFSSTLPP